jgi:hypothetical protein
MAEHRQKHRYDAGIVRFDRDAVADMQGRVANVTRCRLSDEPTVESGGLDRMMPPGRSAVASITVTFPVNSSGTFGVFSVLTFPPVFDLAFNANTCPRSASSTKRRINSPQNHERIIGAAPRFRAASVDLSGRWGSWF